MRPTLALLALALLLAGCLQDAGTPSSSTPPPGGSSTPASSTPVSSTPADGPATHGAAVLPARGSNATSGFTLEGNESVALILPGQEVDFTFVGTNGGANATVLSDPCGEGNPAIRILDANGTVLDVTGPVMHCMAMVSWQPFGAGEQVWNNVTWDGMAWNGTDRAPVPSGTYTAQGTFRAQRDGAEVSVVVELPISVTTERGVL